MVRAFGLGTGAFALWMDVGLKLVKVRHYDARMVVPLSWDSESVRECAFVMRAFLGDEGIDQLQMHVIGDDDTYCIRPVCFDKDGHEMHAPGVAEEVNTGSVGPTFGIVRPAVPTRGWTSRPMGKASSPMRLTPFKAWISHTMRSSTRSTRGRCASFLAM